jgi:hypothetical protein
MEAVAPPGGVMVMIDRATGRERRHTRRPELVHIKGTPLPVSARRLLAIATGRRTDRVEPSFVGRVGDGRLGRLDRQSTERAVVGGRPAWNRQERIVREIASRATMRVSGVHHLL